jgi:hypothetical protein
MTRPKSCYGHCFRCVGLSVSIFQHRHRGGWSFCSKKPKQWKQGCFQERKAHTWGSLLKSWHVLQLYGYIFTDVSSSFASEGIHFCFIWTVAKKLHSCKKSDGVYNLNAEPFVSSLPYQRPLFVWAGFHPPLFWRRIVIVYKTVYLYSIRLWLSYRFE